MNAISPTMADALAMTTALSLPGSGDALLISRCRAYVDALQTYDAEGGVLESDEDPLWAAVENARYALIGLRATTLPGFMAKAEVANYHASQPDGRSNWSDSFTGTWLVQITEDLVALGDGTFAVRSDLPPEADAVLLALKVEYDAVRAAITEGCRKSARGGPGYKKRVARQDAIILEGLAMPPARSTDGKSFQSWLRYLAHVHRLPVPRRGSAAA